MASLSFSLLWSSLLGVLICLATFSGGLVTAAGGAALVASSAVLPDATAVPASAPALTVHLDDRRLYEKDDDDDDDDDDDKFSGSDDDDDSGSDDDDQSVPVNDSGSDDVPRDRNGLVNTINNYGIIRENTCATEYIALYCEATKLKNVVIKGLDGSVFCLTTLGPNATYFLMGNCLPLIPPTDNGGIQLDVSKSATCDGYTPPGFENPCGFDGEPLVLLLNDPVG